MQAIVVTEAGLHGQLQVQEVPEPELGEDEVLVAVKAISVNPVDTLVRQSGERMERMLGVGPADGNVILGWDVSGTVERVGSGVTRFSEGVDVFGMVNFPGHGKAYAEYVAAPAAHLAKKPDGISHHEAAAATLAALTAWQALVARAGLQAGETVLIHAAGGGVGHYAVQIAKYLGARVVGTASPAKRDFVLSLGADEVVDYTSEAFCERVQDADVVLDSIPGEEHLLRSLDAVKRGGRLISIKEYFNDRTEAKARDKDVAHERMLVRSNGEEMEEIARLLGEGHLRSHISAVYQFHQMAEAHKAIEGGKTQGKIVVERA
jgi:NADPH:quinone reductase-like Zn-dependent oxidoreductase